MMQTWIHHLKMCSDEPRCRVFGHCKISNPGNNALNVSLFPVLSPFNQLTELPSFRRRRQNYLTMFPLFHLRYSLSYIPFARRIVSDLMVKLCDTELWSYFGAWWSLSTCFGAWSPLQQCMYSTHFPFLLMIGGRIKLSIVHKCYTSNTLFVQLKTPFCNPWFHLFIWIESNSV